MCELKHVFMLASQWFKQVARTSDEISDSLSSGNISNFRVYWGAKTGERCRECAKKREPNPSSLKNLFLGHFK